MVSGRLGDMNQPIACKDEKVPALMPSWLWQLPRSRSGTTGCLVPSAISDNHAASTMTIMASSHAYRRCGDASERNAIALYERR